MSAATPSTATRVTPRIKATSRFAKLPVLVAGAVAAAAGAVVLCAYGTLAAVTGPFPGWSLSRRRGSAAGGRCLRSWSR